MHILKNFIEDVVDNVLSEVLDNYPELCKCSKCILDIKAIALNNLPTKYIVSEKGEVYSKIEAFNRQFEIDVTQQLINAIEKVKKYPHEYHRGE